MVIRNNYGFYRFPNMIIHVHKFIVRGGGGGVGGGGDGPCITWSRSISTLAQRKHPPSKCSLINSKLNNHNDFSNDVPV